MGDRRGGLRVGARRQPARLQFAARHRRLRPCAAIALPSWYGPGPSSPFGTAPARRRRSLDTVRHSKGPRRTAEIRLDMQRVMQNNCAVFPYRRVLREGVSRIDVVAHSFTDLGISDRSMIWNSDLARRLELENLLEQAVSPCIRRERTEAGAHAREDYPSATTGTGSSTPLSASTARGVSRSATGPVLSYAVERGASLPAQGPGLLEDQDGRIHLPRTRDRYR